MLKIIRRDLLKAGAAVAAQSAIWPVLPSWAGVRGADGTTYYPTILGAGGHNGDSTFSNEICFGNVGLGRSALESPPVTNQAFTSQPIRVPGSVTNLSWGLDYSGSEYFTAITFRLNQNSAPTALAVSFAGAASGWLSDQTDVVVNSGDTLDFAAYVEPPSDGGAVSGVYYCASTQFVSSDTSDPPIQSAQMIATVGSSQIFPSSTTQKFVKFLGILGGTLSNGRNDADPIERDQMVFCLAAGAWRNMACYIINNIVNGTTIINNRITHANGSMALNILSNTSGYFEDTGDYDSVAEGDLLDYGIMAGNTIADDDYMVIGWIGAHFAASNPAMCMIGGAPAVPGSKCTLGPSAVPYYSSLFGGGNPGGSAYENRSAGMFPYGVSVEYWNNVIGWSGSGSTGNATFNLISNPGLHQSTVLSSTVSQNVTGWVKALGAASFGQWDVCANQISVGQSQELVWGGSTLLVAFDPN